MSYAQSSRAILFTLLAVCAAVPSAQTPDPKLLGYPAVGQPGVVKLISPGAEPRIPLRYGVPKDYKAGMEMTMEMSLTMSMAGQSMPEVPVPAMKMGANISVVDVAANGDISYKVAFTGMSIPAGGDPMVMAAFQGMDADYKTVTGEATITNRGVAKAVKFDYSKISNPQLSQLMGSATGTLENMSMPLPEEAVGIGARWEVRQSTTAAGIQGYIRSDYEIVSIDGKTVTLKAKQETMALPQTVNNPMMPPGTESKLQSMTGTGSGTMKIRLDTLIPTSTLEVVSNMAIEVSARMDPAAPPQTMNMGTETKMKVSIVPGPPK